VTAFSPAKTSVLGGIALWAMLALPPLRRGLETEMVLQMIVQLPLLGLVGGMIAPGLRRFEPGWLREADRLGLPGLTLAVFAITYWMLPRSLDSALADRRIEAAKFVALPLLAGLPLAVSWRRLPGLGKSFLAANALSMLGTVGGLYLAAPVRLCAYYRIDQQAATGTALVALAAVAGLLWLLAALSGRHPPAAIGQDAAGGSRQRRSWRRLLLEAAPAIDDVAAVAERRAFGLHEPTAVDEVTRTTGAAEAQRVGQPVAPD